MFMAQRKSIEAQNARIEELGAELHSLRSDMYKWMKTLSPEARC
jgi:hypothetical protein